MNKYRKKPVVIEAIQWTGKNIWDVRKFVGNKASDFNGKFNIRTLEGTMSASIGDFIIKGVHGEFYPCKPDIFSETYEAVGAEVVTDTNVGSKWTPTEPLTNGQRWIPVTERLPERKQDVLMCFDTGNMAVGWWYDRDEVITFWSAYSDDGWYTDCDCEPLYWMPLPEPPKEE